MNRFYHASFHTNDGILSSRIEKSEILSNSLEWVRLKKVIYEEYIKPIYITTRTGLFKKEVEVIKGYLTDYTLIFEDAGNYLIEVVTGRKYEKYINNNSNGDNDNILFYFEKNDEIESKYVVEMLKSLTEEDIRRIKDKFNKLDELIKKRIEEIKYDDSQEEINRQYILDFRIKHGSNI